VEPVGSSCFSDEEIDAANDYVCGTGMLEGAPHLEEEHLPFLTVPTNVERKARGIFMPMAISA
jgi:ribonucleoside-diphosphate reductase alpha chain